MIQFLLHSLISVTSAQQTKRSSLGAGPLELGTHPEWWATKRHQQLKGKIGKQDVCGLNWYG